LEFLCGEQLAPPSMARHLVSLRMFYRFLRLEERTTVGTVDLLASPSLWARIPQVLSPESVTKLLEAPLSHDRFYLRDRAILETLSATGSRASEVVNLKREDVHLESAFLKCFGKGNKQRIVPWGQYAITALNTYLNEFRPSLAQNAPDCPWVFVSRGRRQLTREMLWVLVKKYVKRAGLHSKVSPTPCGTASPRTCWPAGPICARCRKCSAMQAVRPPSATRTSIAIGSRPFTSSFNHAAKLRARITCCAGAAVSIV
jgi:integrase/recombinase XerD